MEDNTGSRESKKKSMEDNTRSSESREKRRKSMEDNTRSSESKEKRRKSMEDNTRPTTAILVLRFGDVPSSAVVSSHIPSLFKKARPRKPREMINHHTSMPPPRARIQNTAVRSPFRKLTDATTKHHENSSYSPVVLWQVEDLAKMASPPLRWAGSSSPHVEPGQNIVLVRPKPLGNPTAPMEADEKIIEEKAVCKVCFAILREEENILKTKCKCSNALIHETCVADGNNCGNCQQKVQTFPVTLVRGLSSSTPVIKKKAKNVLGRFHG